MHNSIVRSKGLLMRIVPQLGSWSAPLAPAKRVARQLTLFQCPEQMHCTHMHACAVYSYAQKETMNDHERIALSGFQQVLFSAAFLLRMLWLELRHMEAAFTFCCFSHRMWPTFTCVAGLGPLLLPGVFSVEAAAAVLLEDFLPMFSYT